MKKRGLRGYFTVEAGLVFPIVLGVLCFLIFLMFFLHGRVMISSNAYGGAIYASGLKEDELDIYLGEYKGFHKSKREVLGNWRGKCELYDKGNKIIARIEASMLIPMFFISSKDRAKVSINGFAVKNEAVKIIRNTRMVENVMKFKKDKENFKKNETNNKQKGIS